MFRHLGFGIAIAFLASVSIRTLYLEDIRYSRPTPIPKNYVQIAESEQIVPPHQYLVARGKPLFLHFFNPECPCSKFNTEHFAELVRKYQKEADFIVITPHSIDSTLDSMHKWGIDIPVYVDETGKIAKTYGVYSTPQAVIMDSTGKLFYRGNYNKSRYCSLKSSEYARIALEAILRKEKIPDLPLLARIAYGCEFPTDDLESQKLKFLDEFFAVF